MWRCSIGFSYLSPFATNDSTSAIASPTHWHSVTTVVSQLQLLYSLHIYWPRLVFFYILCVTHMRGEVNGFICLIYYRIFTRKCNKVSTPEESWSQQSVWHSLPWYQERLMTSFIAIKMTSYALCTSLLIHGKNKTEQLVMITRALETSKASLKKVWQTISEEFLYCNYDADKAVVHDVPALYL